MNEEEINCPHCGNPDILSDAIYCDNCGNPIENHCSNQSCLNAQGLPATAVYCPDCGCKSTFAVDGFISPRVFDRE